MEQDRWDCQPYLGQLLSITSASEQGTVPLDSGDLGTGKILRDMVSTGHGPK